MNETIRKADHAVADMFTSRWSPRAFTTEPIGEDELLLMLEAARWAPSAFNAQPWRFVYAMRDDPAWDNIFGALVPINQSWVQRAAALVIVTSNTLTTDRTTGELVQNTTHEFDTGSAWGFLALQAHISGWVAHGMIGFDRLAMANAIALPDDHELHAAVAIGRHGDLAELPDALRAREAPSLRLPLQATAFRGAFLNASTRTS